MTNERRHKKVPIIVPPSNSAISSSSIQQSQDSNAVQGNNSNANQDNNSNVNVHVNNNADEDASDDDDEDRIPLNIEVVDSYFPRGHNKRKRTPARRLIYDEDDEPVEEDVVIDASTDVFVIDAISDSEYSDSDTNSDNDK